MPKTLEEYTKEELIEVIKNLKRRKKFGLVWEDKAEEVVRQVKTELPVIEEVASRAIDKVKDAATNFIIEGDNYYSLSTLNYTHTGRVDVIYIDPPYNTGNKDFIYEDRYIDREDTYRHSKWLSFMSKRLLLAKELLANTGIVFISIDDNELSNLRLLCDGIFGSDNFIGTLPRVTKKSGKQHSGDVANNHDYVLVYVKNKPLAKFRGIELDDDKYPLSDEYENERGKYKLNQTLDYDSLFYNPAMDYAIDYEGQTFVPGGDIDKQKARHSGDHKNIDWVWRWSLAKFRFGAENGFVVIKKGKNGSRLYTKTYSRATITKNNGSYVVEYLKRENNLSSIAFVDNKYSNDNAKKELAAVLPGISFDYPKPSVLISDLLRIVAKQDALVLDFFAGSGTTGQAVLNINKEDGGNRRFILCTNNENGIAENITYQRVKNVVDGYAKIKGIPANLRYFKTALVSKQQTDDQTRIELVARSTDMICLREDAFEKVIDTKLFKVFGNVYHYAAIVFEAEAIVLLKDSLAKLKDDKPIHIYVFSLSNDTYESDFADLEREHELRPIPESILEVYRRIHKAQGEELGL